MLGVLNIIALAVVIAVVITSDVAASLSSPEFKQELVIVHKPFPVLSLSDLL